MKNQWLNFMTGVIQVNAKGKGIERFINQCIQNDINIWNVKRQGTESVTFFMLLKDVSKVRRVVRTFDCKLFFIQKVGLPFLMKKILTNSGFLLGVLLFFVIMILLSNIVWQIEIDGAQPQTEHQIYQHLDEMGVKKGKLQFLLEDVDVIQQQLTNNIDSITWIGVELRGTTYHFQVVEKEEPEEPEQIGPQHLVAKKESVITEMFVEEGQAIVEINQHVNKGELLVSGMIGKEDNTQIVAARGKVYGETWYRATVKTPLSQTIHVLTGNSKSKHLLSFGGVTLPFWGFAKNDYRNYEAYETTKDLHLLNWKLPVSYMKNVIRETETVERVYSVKQAKELAIESARTELQTKLDEDATIKEEKVLHETNENGKLKVEIIYTVIENIAIEKPIIQGD
ncbi:sporulation protein YqfD [Cytobacillus sp. IB215316]|uniref:sporulation protein YqfD n=1 Tax=Cytobacillus sp. IB215316 TaxID=3097354 RepID=UPI002A0C8137|nr:sporulation protein YqfD [Cytobacillus sp. IB215316]MDX8359546.1 sporulation protein YqfD [Cytobacillus sp. IB215316]